MRKKWIAILATVVMLASLFLFVGCDEPSVSNPGDNDNGENKNNEIIGGKEDGEIVDEEANKEIYDFALGALSEEDFRLSVSLDKENYQVGDKINVAVTLTNLSGKDITVEIPDWIAALHNGKSMEDTIEFCFAPKGSDNAWKDIAFSVAVVPRPRTVFQKDATIERTFEYAVTEKSDLEMQISAIFYYGGEEESRFEKFISIKNDFEVAVAEE